MCLLKIARADEAQSQVREAPGNLQRARAGHERLVQLSEIVVSIRQERADPASPAVVVQPLSQGLGLAQALQHPAAFTENTQHWPQLEPDIEALLHGGRALGQRLEGTQCLLEEGEGFSRRGPRVRFESCLPEIVDRLLPQFAPEGVIREPLDVLAEPLAVKRLDRAD